MLVTIVKNKSITGFANSLCVIYKNTYKKKKKIHGENIGQNGLAQIDQ